MTGEFRPLKMEDNMRSKLLAGLAAGFIATVGIAAPALPVADSAGPSRYDPFMPPELPPLDRNDMGRGSFKDYKYRLTPNSAKVRLRLAGSNPHQTVLKDILDSGYSHIETAISRRTQQQDAVDAPIEVRLFTGAKVSGPVGWVPRGLESVVDETLSRLEMRGRKPRIVVKIVRARGLYRVDLLIGLTR